MAKPEHNLIGSIGAFQRELAARGQHRSVDTLRTWDRIGIVRADRTELGQRVYRDEHVERALRFIESHMKRRGS